MTIAVPNVIYEMKISINMNFTLRLSTILLRLIFYTIRIQMRNSIYISGTGIVEQPLQQHKQYHTMKETIFVYEQQKKKNKEKLIGDNTVVGR